MAKKAPEDYVALLVPSEARVIGTRCSRGCRHLGEDRCRLFGDLKRSGASFKRSPKCLSAQTDYLMQDPRDPILCPGHEEVLGPAPSPEPPGLNGAPEPSQETKWPRSPAGK